MEEAFSFGRFQHDAITDTELEAKSQVLVIGQYSTGKTTVRFCVVSPAKGAVLLSSYPSSDGSR